MARKSWHIANRDRLRGIGDGLYSMSHQLPWTDPRSDWMRGRALEVADGGPGWRWGLKPRKKAA